MFSQITIVLLSCQLSVSITPITIYKNAQFVPINTNYKLADLFWIDSQNRCICQCLTNVKCLTVTYFNFNQTCSLFSAQLKRNWLRLTATIMNASVISLKNKSAPIVNFTEMYTATPQSTGGNYTYLNAIAMGNLNGDSMMDMTAVYRSSRKLVVWLGQGNGTFNIGQPYTTDVKPYDLSIADLTGDGRLDILVLCFGSSTINLFINQGNGTFVANLTVGSTGSSSYPFQMVLADMDGNGWLDVVAATWHSPFVSVLLNRGYSNWTQFVLVTNTSYPFTSSSAPVSAVVNDFNQDSILDVAVVTLNGSVAIFLGQGNGILTAPILYTTAGATGYVSSLVAFDANEDGKVDLAVTNERGNSTALLFGDGQGHLSAPTLYSNLAAPSVMRLADVNQDGYLDLLFLRSSNCYTLLSGNANGTFVTTISCGPVSIGYGTGLAIGDINNNGTIDMVIGASLSTAIKIFLGSVN